MQHGLVHDLEIQRLTDDYASAAANSALQAAARATAGPSSIGSVLSAAMSPAFGNGYHQADAAPGVSADRARFWQAVADPVFVAVVPDWVRELRTIAVSRPGTGACTAATALQLWAWTMNHFLHDANARATAIAELADSFRSLLAARCLILDITDEATGPSQFLSDLCHVAAARAASNVGSVCAQLVFGYRRHLFWDAEGCTTCYCAEELEALEGVIPGIASGARSHSDVIESDGSHATKAGPCAGITGLETFTRLRARLDACLTGARFARDRAATVLPDVLAGEAPASTRSSM